MKRYLYGLVVLGLLLGAVGQGRSDFMYWTDYFGGDIRRANLDGSGQTTLVSGQAGPNNIALDLAGGQMYWTDFDGGDIRRANLDGSGQTTLLGGLNTPHGLALDLAGGQMYWTERDGGDIARANLDGRGKTTLVRNLGNPRGIVLDLVGGQMYWTDGGFGQILRANLDGTGQKILVSGQAAGAIPRYMALDLAGGKMYWTTLNSNEIRRANLDGTGPEILIRNLPGGLGGIALDVAHGFMYWADFNGQVEDIRRASLDGSGQTTLVSGLVGPEGIALDLSAPVPVVVTGYSADVISDKDPQARFAQPFGAGTFAWFEAGAVDDSGAQHNDGLPAALTFISATGSGATYQLQPANANNVLQLSAGQSGTLTLTTPAAYSTLYVIASSGDGTPSSAGSGTITFADGSTQAFSYNGFDWCNGQGGLHPEAILKGPNGRADIGPDGTAFLYNQDCDFQVYETVIAIDSSHAGVAIASIEFSGAPDAFFSNIFGVSGR